MPLCKGAFSAETVQLLRDDETARFNKHLCVTCHTEQLAENKSDRWLPVNHQQHRNPPRKRDGGKRVPR